MNALETRRVNNTPNPEQEEPFHPETHRGFDDLDISHLPIAGYQGSGWKPTGFIIDGSKNFIGGVLKERFFHNPSVGYALSSEGFVVEYEKIPTLQRQYGVAFR